MAPLDTKARFGKQLRKLRLERGLRQLDVAVGARISENYVSDLELGRKEVCLKTIYALAKALGVPAKDLIL